MRGCCLFAIERHGWGRRISGGHPCMWTLGWYYALSFGEGAGGKFCARGIFTASSGVHIRQCVHLGRVLDPGLDDTNKKAWTVRCPIHTLRPWESALYCWTNNSIAHADMIYSNYRTLTQAEDIVCHSGRAQYLLMQNVTTWYIHTRDIYRCHVQGSTLFLEISHVSECTLNLTLVNAFYVWTA